MKDENVITLSYTRACKTAQVEVLQLEGGGKQFTAWHETHGADNGGNGVIVKTGGEADDGSITALWLDENCSTKATAVGRMSDRGAMEWAALTAIGGAKIVLALRNQIESAETESTTRPLVKS